MTCENQGPKTASDHGSCSPALRNRYFRGKLLTVADYKTEQRYLIQRRRLVNRAVLGWGVISGLTVALDKNKKIVINHGVAFDRRGREVVACDEVTLDSEDDVVWLSKDDPRKKAEGKPANGKYLLSAHYAECLVDGVRIEEGCGQCSDEWNHVRETVIYSLRELERKNPLLPLEQDCPSGRPGCHKPHYDKSDCSAVRGKGDSQIPHGVEDPADDDDRGPHATLCEWSGDRLNDSFDPCAAYELCSGDCIRFDPADGVPLACVKLYFDEHKPAPGVDGCRHIVFTEVEEGCDARRLVHPNDVLYDLLRGCDLTRIESIGWSEARAVPREEFAGLFRPGEKRKPVDTGFSICFTQPVQVASLTTDVITMTLFQPDSSERRNEVHRVPIEALWIAPKQGDDPPGTTRGFRPMVAWQFWRGEIEPDAKSGFDNPTIVEIEVRGDFILDWRGQTVDANRFGRRFPTGNGTPGGTFLSTFVVDPEKKAGQTAGTT